MAIQLQNKNSCWTIASILNQASIRIQSLVSAILSSWYKSGSLSLPLIVPVKYQIPPSAKWLSHTTLTISTERGQFGETILDYGRLPIFEISSLTSKANSVRFHVVYSESFKGLENEDGEIKQY
jgi:hypothetical protein